MSVRITTIDELQDYLCGVQIRIDHHAQPVDEVIFRLLGAAVMFKDRGTAIEVRGQEGDLKNVMWVRINGTRYCLRYEHNPPSVDIKVGGLQGATVGTVDNATSVRDVLTLFRSL